MKVAAYCRVSTDSEDQANSYENQKLYFENEIGKAGHEKVEIYADKGLTGTKLNNRPEFNRMLIDAGIDIFETYSGKDRRVNKKHVNYEESERTPLFDEIWIKNTSRFARNTLSFEIISRLRNKGVNIRFIEQNINTKDVSSDFLLKLFQVFDEQESRDKSSKVTFGKKIGARKGIISTSSNIYGYKYISSTNSLEIIPHEANVITKIYDLYLRNFGIRRIINYLEDNKLFTRQGKVFTPSTIKRILTNEKYAGINVRMKYSSGKVFNKFSYPHINPKDEWIIQENHERIPVIISKETFEKVQETLENKVNRQNQKGIYTGVSEYAGLIYCGNCGDVYHSNCDNGRHFYNCKTKRKKGTKVCNNPNISLDKLNKAIENSSIFLREQQEIRKYVDKLNALCKTLNSGFSNSDERQASEYIKTLNHLKGKKDKYVEMYSDSIIDKDTMKEKVAIIDNQIHETEQIISRIQGPNLTIQNDIKEIKATIQFLEKEEANFKKNENHSMSREDIIKLIDMIVIDENGNPNIIFTMNAKYKEIFEKHARLYKDMVANE
jgi:site-specific DNA recombinase